MPRQRRRSRRSPPTYPTETRLRQEWDLAADRRASDRRPVWLPTLGVFVAFSLGLWIGGILSVADSASAVALLGGALGLGIGGARMLGSHLRERRRQMMAERRGRDARDASRQRVSRSE